MLDQRIELIETYHIDMYDLMAIIDENYPVEDFEIIPESNDSSHSVKVEKKANRIAALEGFHEKDLEKIRVENSCEIYLVHHLMDDLADRDILPEGEYIIHVSW